MTGYEHLQRCIKDISELARDPREAMHFVGNSYGRHVYAALFDEWIELAETIPDDAERFAWVQRIEQIRDQELAWLPTISARVN